MPSLLDRMLSYISPEPNTGCWLWTAAANPNGYGQIRLSKTVLKLAHVVCYELYRGPVPNGMELDHLCRVRCCVNPHHLEPVTHLENVRRGAGHGKETHCPQGHAYNQHNTCYRSNGTRQCRVCNRNRMSAKYAINKDRINAERRKARSCQ